MPEIIYIPTDEIKFIFRRPRDQEVFEKEIKGAIREIGVIQPLKGIDISDWKPERRRRPDGGLYTKLAGFGEGRTRAVAELYKETKGDRQWRTVPFIIYKVPIGELLAWFLSENNIRVPLPWPERAELLQAGIDAGLTPAQLAEKNHMTAGHVEKLLRVAKRLSPTALEAVRELTVQAAETLSRQPKAHQEIIVETVRDSGLPGSEIPAVVRMAQEQVYQNRTLTKTDLMRDVARLKQNVLEQRPALKVKRAHFDIGVVPYGDAILRDKEILGMLNKRGIEWRRFMDAYEAQ